eukprot:jgi/Mesvir1/16078/Mv08372-RA.1
MDDGIRHTGTSRGIGDWDADASGWLGAGTSDQISDGATMRAIAGPDVAADATDSSTSRGDGVVQNASFGGTALLALTLANYLWPGATGVLSSHANRLAESLVKTFPSLGKMDTNDVTAFLNKLTLEDRAKYINDVLIGHRKTGVKRTIRRTEADDALDPRDHAKSIFSAYQNVADGVVKSVQSELSSLDDPNKKKQILDRYHPAINAIANSPLLTRAMYERILDMYNVRDDPRYPYTFVDSVRDPNTLQILPPTLVVDRRGRLRKVLPDSSGYLGIVNWDKRDNNKQQSESDLTADRLFDVERTLPLVVSRRELRDVLERVKSDRELRETYETEIKKAQENVGSKVDELLSSVAKSVVIRQLPQDLRNDEWNKWLDDFDKRDYVGKASNELRQATNLFESTLSARVNEIDYDQSPTYSFNIPLFRVALFGEEGASNVKSHLPIATPPWKLAKAASDFAGRQVAEKGAEGARKRAEEEARRQAAEAEALQKEKVAAEKAAAEKAAAEKAAAEEEARRQAAEAEARQKEKAAAEAEARQKEEERKRAVTRVALFGEEGASNVKPHLPIATPPWKLAKAASDFAGRQEKALNAFKNGEDLDTFLEQARRDHARVAEWNGARDKFIAYRVQADKAMNAFASGEDLDTFLEQARVAAWKGARAEFEKYNVSTDESSRGYQTFLNSRYLFRL